MRRNRSTGLLVVLLVTGALVGGALGQVFTKYLPFLALGETVGFSPTTLNLSVLQFTLGISLRVTIAGIIGLLLGYLLYRQL
ncbi:MAG TPA: DUF4321 domain-containing protein [Firmicutes bacterium]|nr:DUF4321 domain-containing protein [Bacillota bacterium]